jgi:hypothetical protein
MQIIFAFLLAIALITWAIYAFQNSAPGKRHGNWFVKTAPNGDRTFTSTIDSSIKIIIMAGAMPADWFPGQPKNNVAAELSRAIASRPQRISAPTPRSNAVTVAITGTLRMKRSDAIYKINETNAKYSERVWSTTDYLVAASFDTAKALNAAKLGVRVLSEDEFVQMLESGHFKPRAEQNVHPAYNRIYEDDEYDWTEQFDPPRPCRLRYKDSRGEITDRQIELSHKGTAPNGHAYIGAYDIGEFKTFRTDRILELEEL